MRDPPTDKIVPERYWKVRNTAKLHKESPIGFIACISCGLYFPVYRRGVPAKRCYRCYMQVKNKRHLSRYMKIPKISEDDFCILVLARAKQIFGEDAAKIDLDRMIKLCCFVAEDVGFPLTRGWYKEV